MRAELGGIEGIRQLAIERAGDGLTREEFEGRRRELLLLIDAIEQRAGDPVRPRVTALRQRAMALQPGTAGDEDTRRRRRQRQRQLDRLVDRARPRGVRARSRRSAGAGRHPRSRRAGPRALPRRARGSTRSSARHA